MKKWLLFFFALMLAVASVTSSVAFAEGVTVISDDEGVSGSLQIGETVSIEKVCDFTLLSYVADTYALSIPAYERPDDELFTTPEHEKGRDIGEGDYWGQFGRYKYALNDSGKTGYAVMYYDIYAAQKASSDEYKLLDVRVSILNKMISPIDIEKVFSAKAVYMDEYAFPVTYVCMETADTLGNQNEWLVDAKPIPMLVQRNIHFIFEVPNVVAESRESLVVTLSVDKDEYEIVIR